MSVQRKRTIIIIFIVALITGVGLYLLFSNGNNSLANNNNNNQANDNDQKKDDSDHGVDIPSQPGVDTKIDKEKPYIYNKETFDPCEGEDFLIMMPYINLDFPHLRQINKELNEKFQLYKSRVVYDEDYCISSMDVSNFKWFENNGVISLVIDDTDICVPCGHLTPEYTIYNINVETGKLLSNKELLGVKDITEEAFITKVKQVIDDYYEQDFGDDSGYDDELQDEWQECKRLAKNYVNIDLPIFLNEENKLVIVIYIFGIADAYKYELILDI
jgi:hypothetical protein